MWGDQTALLNAAFALREVSIGKGYGCKRKTQ